MYIYMITAYGMDTSYLSLSLSLIAPTKNHGDC